MNREFCSITSFCERKVRFGILKYWVTSLPRLYNDWYNWFDKEEPARVISEIISKYGYGAKDKNQIRILDCACGTGNPSLALTKGGFKVICSDGSAEMLKLAKHNSRRMNVPLQIVSRPVLWEQLTEYFGQDTFDVVLCTGNSLCHVPPDAVKESIKQMAGLLAKDGLLIIDAKRYDNRIRELEYRKGQGWIPRSQRLDRRVIAGNRAQMLTHLAYLDEDRPGRKYQVRLDSNIGGDCKRHAFSVWAITSEMIKDSMKQARLHIFPLYEGHNHLAWQYDLCVGKKG